MRPRLPWNVDVPPGTPTKADHLWNITSVTEPFGADDDLRPGTWLVFRMRQETGRESTSGFETTRTTRRAQDTPSRGTQE